MARSAAPFQCIGTISHTPNGTNLSSIQYAFLAVLMKSVDKGIFGDLGWHEPPTLTGQGPCGFNSEWSAVVESGQKMRTPCMAKLDQKVPVLTSEFSLI